MTVKVYVESSLHCERKGGSKVLVHWLEGSTTGIVDSDLLEGFLLSHGCLRDADVRQFFDKHSRQKQVIVFGSFALDELLLTLLNLEYTIYPDRVARHDVYVAQLGDSLAVNATVDIKPALHLADAGLSAVEFFPRVAVEDMQPPACQPQGCVMCGASDDRRTVRYRLRSALPCHQCRLVKNQKEKHPVDKKLSSNISVIWDWSQVQA